MKKRQIEVSVISDLHLATHASQPKKVIEYLKSIDPKILVLNGDIIDAWRFTRNYFPKNHMKVIRHLIKLMEKGTDIFYVTGNHDEFLRKFNGTQAGRLKIVNQYIFEHAGTKTWIFHGDIFDKIIHSSRGLAKLGAALYGLLTLLNKVVNFILRNVGGKDIIIYKSVRKNFVREKRKPSKFENEVAKSAISQGYQAVICGHTHVPKEKSLEVNGKEIQYINCGDWVENLTAAEFYNNKWHLYTHPVETDENEDEELDIQLEQFNHQRLLEELTFTNLIQIQS